MARAKRRLGQHFLADPRILARIADALGAGRSDTVVEIGPGAGGLTAALAARAGRVLAIELDRELVPSLRARLPTVEVIEGDALAIDWPALAGEHFLLTGNIPYNITSPLLDKALRAPVPQRIVFLVQKEVADRITAAPESREYGALSVGVQAVMQTERLFTVAAGSFQPRPQVDSAVIRLIPRPDPLVPPAQRESFRAAVVGLFGFRRKQLLRGLRELTGWEPERAGGVLQKAGIEGTRRPEVLSPAQFAELHRALVDGGWQARVAL